MKMDNITGYQSIYTYKLITQFTTINEHTKDNICSINILIFYFIIIACESLIYLAYSFLVRQNEKIHLQFYITLQEGYIKCIHSHISHYGYSFHSCI